MTIHKLFQRRLLAILVIALALALSAFPSRIRAQGSDPVSVWTAFNEASSGATNPDAALALVADDITIRVDPPTPANPSGIWTGKEGARAFVQMAASQNPRRELIGQWQVNGDKLSGTIKITNNNFRQWGVGAVEHTLEAVVQGGKLKSVLVSMSPAERPRVAAAQAAAQQAPQTMPKTGGTMLPDATPLLVLGGLALVTGLALKVSAARRR
jgi:hypothetical protein